MRRLWNIFSRELSSILAAGFASFIAFTGIVKLSGLLAAPDPAVRLLAGFILSAGLWLYALMASRLVTHSSDQVLFDFTPLTARRYFLRNMRIHWPHLVAAYLAVPWITAVLWAHAATPSMLRAIAWQPLTIVNALFAYYAMLLVPLAQEISGPGLPAQYVFITRHVFRLLPGPAIATVVLGGIANWVTDGAVVDFLYVLARTLLELNGFGLVLLALLSPASVPLVQEAPGMSEQAVVICTALWSISAVWALVAATFGLTRPTPQWEHEMFDSWLDARREVEEQEEQAAEEEETAFAAWAEKSFRTYADDVDDVGPGSNAPPYDPTASPEDQFLRDARFAITRDDSVSESLAGRIANRAFRYPWATIVALLWIAWPWTVVSGRDEVWPGKIALFLALIVGFFANAWWTDALNSGLAIPIRLTRIIPKAFWSRWLQYTLPCDALAITLWAVSLRIPVVPALSILGVIQIVRVAGALHTWVDVVGSAGSHQVLKLVDLVAAAVTILFGLMTVVIFPAEDDPHIFEKLPIHIVAYVAAGSLVAVYALLLLWTHRRSDSTLPQHHTSYVGFDAD